MDDGIGINAGDFNGGIGNFTRCEEGDGIRRRAIRVGWVDAGEGVACQVGNRDRRRTCSAIGDGHGVGATRVERFGRMDGDGYGPGFAGSDAARGDGWQRKWGIDRAGRRHGGAGAHTLASSGIPGARDRHRGRHRDGRLIDGLLEAHLGAVIGRDKAYRFGEGDRDREGVYPDAGVECWRGDGRDTWGDGIDADPHGPRVGRGGGSEDDRPGVPHGVNGVEFQVEAGGGLVLSGEVWQDKREGAGGRCGNCQSGNGALRCDGAHGTLSVQGCRDGRGDRFRPGCTKGWQAPGADG